jgi:hypothetical protein
MRSLLALALAIVSLCAVAAAQFKPCEFGEAVTVGKTEGVTVRRVSLLESTGEVSATVYLPDSSEPVPGILFSHSAIQGPSSQTELQRFALALARAGAASIVLDGTLEWRTPNDEAERSPHLMACAGQWLLLNAPLDKRRLAIAGPNRHWGGGDTPVCQREEQPCWNPRLWLNFGQTSHAEYVNTQSMLTLSGQLGMARFAQRALRLKEVKPEWLAEPQHQVDDNAPSND